MTRDEMLRAGLLVVVMIAVAAPATAQKVAVKSATPSNGAQGTVNLDILIDGSGFGADSVAQFHVSGTTNPGGVKVNRTTRLSNAQVVANIDIGDLALLSYYDVKVVSNGRTGKGTDLFQVVQKSVSCLPVATPQFGAPVAVLNVGPTYQNGFGHRLQAALVDRPGWSSVVVLFVPNRQERAWVFVLDPASLSQVQTPQEIVLPTQPGAAGPFFPQYGTVMGDLDGNGVPDFAATNSNPGTVYVITGRMDPSSGVLTYSAPALITTPNSGASVTFGAGLGIGDLDGTPGDELLVVQGYARLRGVTYPNRFHVYRFTGTAAAPSLAAWRAMTPAPNPPLGTDTLGGFGVAIGDADGDGDGDIVAASGARTVNGLTDAGEVLMFAGSVLADMPTLALRSPVPTAGERFGANVSFVRNLMSDAVVSVPSLLATAKPAVPYASAYTGPLVGGSPVPDALFSPAPGLGGNWGYHAIVGGDINGDGILDVGISASLARVSMSCEAMGTAHIFVSRDTGGAATWDRIALQPPAPNGGNDPNNFSTGLALVSGLGLVIVGDTGAAVNGVNDSGQVYIYRVIP